jgi:hypothetical protein
MTGRMNWAKARLRGRATLDHRHEGQRSDRASRWLAAVERRQGQRKRGFQTMSATHGRDANMSDGSDP